MAAPSANLSCFPPPPPFYKLFTSTDLEVPPPPLPQGKFTLFGLEFDPDEPPVPPLQSRQLFNIASDGSIDVKGELQRLNKELLLVYCELLKTLVESPESYPAPLTALNQVMSNMQHLVNVLRPVQAVASLENVLNSRIAEKREILRLLRSEMQAVDKGTLEQAEKDLDNARLTCQGGAVGV